MKMDFLNLMQQRYTTKHYDSAKKIPDEILDKILECLRLAPSSINLQPWHFYLTRSEEGKAKIRAAMADFNYGRFDECDSVLILCSMGKVTPEFARLVAAREVEQKRLASDKLEERIGSIIKTGAFKEQLETVRVWSGKQIYIAMATVLYAAASYGIDSTPVEGLNCRLVDQALGLEAQGLHCEAAIYLGVRADSDTNDPKRRPKSRLALDQILTRF